MSMFTPGPWSVVSTPSGKAKVVDSQGFSVANTTNNVWAQGFDDARLIAAAPDLLATAERARRLVTHMCEANDLAIPQSFLDAADAAIAKALGEQA